MQDVIKKFHKSLPKEEYLTSYNMARNCDLVFAEAITHEQFENLNLDKSEYTVYENNSDYLIYRRNYLTISEGDVIFCKGDFIFELFSILNKLKKIDNISILTHQMAQPAIGKELFELRPSCVKFWYALNVDHEDLFLVPVPLGLANEYAKANLQIEDIRNTIDTSDEVYKKNTILVNFNTSTSPKREGVKMYYQDFSWATNKEINSKQSFIKNLNQNKYVVCPEGWGLDTHRYWESLYFGAIPVVDKSYDYNKLHTPAQYEYAKIEEISKEVLELEYKKLTNKLLNNLEKLTISWWFENVIIKEESIHNHKEKIEYKFSNKLTKRYLKLNLKINQILAKKKIELGKNKIGNSYLSIRTLPVNYQKKDSFLFNHELEKYIDSSYFIKKRNLYIRNLDLYSFKYFSWNYKYTKMKKYSTIFSFKKVLKNFRKINFKKQKTLLEKGIWALDEKSFHYFHWFCDTLTRYLQVKKYNDQYPLLISSDLIKKEYILETLNLLNINYSIYDYKVPYKIKNLLISSHITDSGNYSNKNITLLSSLLKSSIEITTPTNRLWISRNKSKHRKIANEDSLIPMLKQYGFQIIYPEDISFIEQLALYRNAETIGGLHGGALTNILFMNEGTKLIEIRRSGDNLNNCYFTLASELKIDYYYLESESIDDDFYISDVKVEVQQLENLVKNIYE